MKPQSGNYQHILIIDDNRMDCIILKEIIQTHNFANYISNFENPITAFNFLKKCTQNFPELIFIDYSMPGLSGLQFIERFTSEFSFPTKFIMVSSSAVPEAFKTSSKYSNVINYLIKPINKLDFSVLEKN